MATISRWGTAKDYRMSTSALREAFKTLGVELTDAFEIRGDVRTLTVRRFAKDENGRKIQANGHVLSYDETWSLSDIDVHGRGNYDSRTGLYEWYETDD